MSSNVIEQAAVILYGNREDNSAAFHTRVKDLIRLDWSSESFTAFSAMVTVEGRKGRKETENWNNISTVNLAKLWLLVNQDYNTNLKRSMKQAGLSDSSAEKTFLSNQNYIHKKTFSILESSGLFSEQELKIIMSHSNKFFAEKNALRGERIQEYYKNNKVTRIATRKNQDNEVKATQVRVTTEPAKKKYKAIIIKDNMNLLSKLIYAAKIIFNGNYEEVNRVNH